MQISTTAQLHGSAMAILEANIPTPQFQETLTKLSVLLLMESQFTMVSQKTNTIHSPPRLTVDTTAHNVLILMLASVTLITQASTNITVCHHASSQALPNQPNKLNTAVKTRHAHKAHSTILETQSQQNSSKWQLLVLLRTVTSLSDPSTTKVNSGNHATSMLATVWLLTETTYMPWPCSTHTPLDAGDQVTLMPRAVNVQAMLRSVFHQEPTLYSQLFSLWYLELCLCFSESLFEHFYELWAFHYSFKLIPRKFDLYQKSTCKITVSKALLAWNAQEWW